MKYLRCAYVLLAASLYGTLLVLTQYVSLQSSPPVPIVPPLHSHSNHDNSTVISFHKKPPMKLRMHWNPTDNRPPYRSLMALNGTIVGNISSLLQFAIIGFGKCGTSTIQHWLQSHNQIQCYPQEVYSVYQRKLGELVQKLYYLPNANETKRGYKSPADLCFHFTMDYFRKYFPQTTLVVGIRHPVWWFQSLYNFRVQNFPLRRNLTDMPRAETLIGRCYQRNYNTCTVKGEFGLYLRNLGKIVGPLDDLERFMYQESKLMERTFTEVTPNPVFLFEINQLADENYERQLQFSKDVQSLLGLDTPLSTERPVKRPGRKWPPPVQAAKDARKINICDSQYRELRQHLMRIARTSSVWIRKRLLPQSDIVVSSPEQFHQLVEGWMHDPCGDDELTKASPKEQTILDQYS